MTEIDHPTNTVQQHRDHPSLTFMDMLGNPHGFITDQEARGQREVVASRTLPTKILHSDNGRADFEALGFVFGEQVPGDPMFTYTTLPERWTKTGSDHDMWSHVCDERGVRRVSVFYKAAFYDREAFMSLDNVGYVLYSKTVYDDHPMAAAQQVDLLIYTAEEIEALQEALEGHLVKDERSPGIYARDERDKEGVRAAQHLLSLIKEAKRQESKT